MDFVFKKGQLKIMEAQDNNELPPLAVNNSENDGDTSSLRNDVSNVSSHNTNGADMVINTQQYTNKPITNNNRGMTMTLPNNGNAATKAAQIINTTPANQLPSTIRLDNGIKRDGNLVEGITFSKTELDKFLKEL